MILVNIHHLNNLVIYKLGSGDRMGCSYSSKPFLVNEEVIGQTSSATEVFAHMNLTDDDINLLYKAFTEIDVKRDATIKPIELFTYTNTELGAFQKLLFGVFDDDNSGGLSFMEFVCAIWNFLTLPETDLGFLVYLMKDPSGTKHITYSNVRELLEVMHKAKVKSTLALRSIYKNLKKSCPPEMSLIEFCAWTSVNPTVLSPLLILQLKIRKQIVGERYWQHMAERREKNPEQVDFGFMLRLRAQVRRKNAEFRDKMIQADIDKLRVEMRGPGNGGNVGRKLSLLLDVYQLKKPRLTSVSPATSNNVEDKLLDTGLSVPPNSVKLKPTPTHKASGAATTHSTPQGTPRSSMRVKPTPTTVSSGAEGNGVTIPCIGSDSPSAKKSTSIKTSVGRGRDTIINTPVSGKVTFSKKKSFAKLTRKESTLKLDI